MSSDTPKKGAVLIVDDTPTNLEVLVDYFADNHFNLFVATDGESALEQINHARPDIILLDVKMPGIDGFETCRRLKSNKKTADIPVIFMTALTDTVDKVKGFTLGAVDYVTKPIQHEEILARVTTHLTLRTLQKRLQEANETLEQRVQERTAELSAANATLQQALTEVERLKSRLQAENIYLREEIKVEYNFDEFIGRSEALKKVLYQIKQVAATDATVLILGESGTGKELIARAVHSTSTRSHHPMVKVNCAALPTNLIESELFGHEKGAFTGALSRKIGRFELADGGTIFLDEVGDLPAESQAKLLRILQEGEFERLGNSRTMKVNVRVIAATNRDLDGAAKKGNFREDLYYRLNVFPIKSPLLRERKEDIPALVNHFLEKYEVRIGKKVEGVSQEVIDALQRYHWPGNVRELENIMERGVILSKGSLVEIEDLPELLPPTGRPSSANTLEEVERDHILRILQETGGVIDGPKGAAVLLALHPNTLRSRLQKLGIKIKRSTA